MQIAKCEPIMNKHKNDDIKKINTSRLASLLLNMACNNILNHHNQQHQNIKQSMWDQHLKITNT